MQLAPLVLANPQGVDGVAVATGRTVNWILDRLEICDWPESLQVHVHNHKITLGAAKRLARIVPPELRETRIAQAAVSGINTRTAALWLADTQAFQTPDSNVSENPHTYTGPTYETETRVHCFVCREPVKTEETVPMRVCNPCLTKLESAHTLPQPNPAT